ncbi:helix-turn-helix transcriptional regulator [Litorimonas haliclonae]|uniref:helix-turn-helix transcriptional regulator n=1 Tax=Litorimonas haliclonae TaxID=2081977 RepID=UPI0039F040A9
MPNHPELVNTLTQYRKAAGLTQSDLADKVSVSRKTINTVENGVFVPTTILSLKLARALEVSVEDLFQLP